MKIVIVLYDLLVTVEQFRQSYTVSECSEGYWPGISGCFKTLPEQYFWLDAHSNHFRNCEQCSQMIFLENPDF